MKKVLSIFLCLIFIFLFACQPIEKDNSNVPPPQEQIIPEKVPLPEDEPKPEEQTPKLVVKTLTQSNFYNYITIKINQISQQATNTRDEIIYGVTIKHYSILTTFSVTSTSNNPSYILENSIFIYTVGLDHKTNSLIGARLDINQDGSGYDTFTIIEYDTTVPYKNYTFQRYFGKNNGESYKLSISGKVKYYE